MTDFVLGGPHLHHVDNLADVVTRTFNQPIGSLVIDKLEFFYTSGPEDKLFYVDGLRFLELYDITVGFERR